MSALLALPAAIALALGGCGGGGDESADAERTIRDFVKATNNRDADAFCDELVTQEFVEQTTLAKGDRAREACKQQLRAVRGIEVELVEIRKTEIDGDNARVTSVLKADGRRQPPRVLRLEKEDGDWRIAGGGGGR